MLYPTVDDLIKLKVDGEVIGNRYRLVNVTAKKARDIAENAIDDGERLDDKPVKLAVYAIIDENYDVEVRTDAPSSSRAG